MLEPSVPSLLKMIGKQLKDKSVKTRLQVFKVLKEIAVVLPEHIVSNIQNFVQPITKALKVPHSHLPFFSQLESHQESAGASSDLKIEVLLFLRVSMYRSNATEFQSTLPQLASAVFDAVGERYYKVTSEALRVCTAMVHVIRPSPDGIVDDSLQSLVPSLYHAVAQRLGAQDVDQEVKEYAIKCMAEVIASLGDSLPDKIETILRSFLERLKSETTRLTTVKALTVIGASSLEFDLSPVISSVITELTVFLKKANVALRQAALRALEVISV